jgi:hypothetical protein
MTLQKTLPSIPADFQPGSFGFHELLDRTCLVAEHFAENIASHPSAMHPKLAATITRLEKGLFDLYQKIGNLHV